MSEGLVASKPPARRPGLTENEVEELRQAFNLFDQDIDKDENGELDFDEFLDLMTSRLAGSDTKEDIERIFKLFDDDQTGYISLQNLKRVARELGSPLNDAELLEMIERADSDNDGLIDMDDFYKIMTQKTFPF
ncbi:hypothetical protein THAOC_08492 [Thalassiosira oceanica]|uniref:EF-hand domain-containing protein n=1 Tax=Thalassiosira oceanica TaxID=159749 RepID=K0TI37_THAOC|nr:hypothetical protein THAOC_08492 [Thalassiosira oceanica]|eukprot:EJK70172.1 hypothetical protein THAOC_08492 [Thalassiosira oceanica]